MKRELGQWMTLVLGGLCGALALVAILQSLGVGSGYHLLADRPAELEAELTQPMQQIEFKLPEFATQYFEIAQRPLFTNDRKPRPIDDKASATASTEAPPVPLNATLLGVLIDPDHQVAILRDNASSTVIRVRQGMPLPGDLAGWTLQELGPRKAIFDGGAQQGTAELKLDMSKTPVAGGRHSCCTSSGRARPSSEEMSHAQTRTSREGLMARSSLLISASASARRATSMRHAASGAS